MNPTSDVLLWRLSADSLLIERNQVLHNAVLGYGMVASWFNRTPPDSLDLEYAIQGIEDAIAPLRQYCASVSDCRSDDALLASWYRKLNLSAGQSLSREAVEWQFEELCAELNRPMASSRLQLTAHEIAYWLILREAMHHLDLPSLTYGLGGATE